MIRLGVVGLRNIGKGHVKRALALKGVEVVAVADADPDRLAAVKAEFGLKYAYTSASELFADRDVDGVVLAVPNHLHAPLAIEALEAGKHVLVEKPIARWTSEAQQMIDARDKTGKILMVGMNQRFSPKTYALRKAIADGAFGHIYLCKTFWNRRRPGDGLWNRGDWFLSKEQSGGGPLLDIGIHKLDLLLFLLGFPKVLSVDGVCFEGIGRKEGADRGVKYEVEDMGMGVIRLEGHTAIHLEASYFHNQFSEEKQAFQIIGTEGGLSDDETYHVVDGEPQPFTIEPDTSAPGACVDHFARVIKGEEKLLSTAEEAMIGLSIIESIYKSSETGRPVIF